MTTHSSLDTRRQHGGDRIVDAYLPGAAVADVESIVLAGDGMTRVGAYPDVTAILQQPA